MAIASFIIAILAVVAASFTAYFSFLTYQNSKLTYQNSKSSGEQLLKSNKDTFKRQHVIDLYWAWKDINSVNPEHPVAKDVQLLVNALSLTATMWNHDIVERHILHQNYWDSFKELYESLAQIENPVEGYDKKGKDFITKEMERAYEDFKSFDLSQVQQTRV